MKLVPIPGLTAVFFSTANQRIFPKNNVHFAFTVQAGADSECVHVGFVL